MNVSAVILAGGESRRMGQDKAWIEIGGEPLIVRALSPIRGAGIETVVISGRPGTDYSGLGCPVLLDLEPGCGPLGGIERALATASSALVLVLAVDLPKMVEGNCSDQDLVARRSFDSGGHGCDRIGGGATP